MNQLTPPRYLEGRALLFAIIALGMGGFGIGVTEFAMMGLLQEGATDLGVSNSQMGLVISTYAIGVVVGAPLLTALAAKISKKRAVQILILLFAVANLTSFFAADYNTMLFTRFLSGLPHGAYFGLAGVLAGNIVPASMRGRAIAWVMLGLSVANVAGVPLVTLLGQATGWRSMFLVVAAVGVLTFVLISLFVPMRKATQGASMRRELSALKSVQVWLAMATGIVGFGGFFAVYSYISPTLTDETGLDIALVPLALGLYGVGMVVGSLIGGRLADWSIFGAIKLASVLMVSCQRVDGFQYADFRRGCLVGNPDLNHGVCPRSRRIIAHSELADAIDGLCPARAVVGGFAEPLSIERGQRLGRCLRCHSDYRRLQLSCTVHSGRDSGSTWIAHRVDYPASSTKNRPSYRC